MRDRVLPRKFYFSDAVTLARSLLGKRSIHRSPDGVTSGRIVETEAYAGFHDAACHSYRRKGPEGNHRTNIMFARGGYAYVYLIYGMYHCFNVVAADVGEPEAVLIRALEPLEGIPLMEKRRQITGAVKKLCNGPGKLCVAMGITREHYGCDLRLGELVIVDSNQAVPPEAIEATPRINVDYSGDAAEYPYRFILRESPFLSRFK
jgi:DNA-3-methyladenine glycosylase